VTSSVIVFEAAIRGKNQYTW